MILQDLIRNYVLYREVIRPLLTSWKDSLTAGYYREIDSNSSSELNLALNKARGLGGGEELGWDISDDYELMCLSQTFGTRTITNYLIPSGIDSQPFYEAKNKKNIALSGSYSCIVLTNSSSRDYIVDIEKTSASPPVLNVEFTDSSLAKTINLTTGFESKQINSYLISETHEKREYLGEFSLTHEETHLLYLKKGGGYHDINQKSIAAII